MTNDNELKVINIISRYGGIDGAHHKQWMLDQIMRIVCKDGYNDWRREWEYGEDGPQTYTWDEGIAP